jgi:hypothetical protein
LWFSYQVCKTTNTSTCSSQTWCGRIVSISVFFSIWIITIRNKVWAILKRIIFD